MVLDRLLASVINQSAKAAKQTQKNLSRTAAAAAAASSKSDSPAAHAHNFLNNGNPLRALKSKTVRLPPDLTKPVSDLEETIKKSIPDSMKFTDGDNIVDNVMEDIKT